MSILDDYYALKAKSIWCWYEGSRPIRDHEYINVIPSFNDEQAEALKDLESKMTNKDFSASLVFDEFLEKIILSKSDVTKHGSDQNTFIATVIEMFHNHEILK